MTPGEFSAYAEMTPPEVMKGVVILVCYNFGLKSMI